MTDHANWRPQAGDVILAVGLLTRMPVRVDGTRAAHRGAASAWAWPVVGGLVGAAGAAVGAVGLWAGLIPGLAAAATLVAQIMITGALHEDGLADTSDGLWGGWDRERRLAIMKDSHIGSYGVLALLMVTLARWLALTVLIAAAEWGAIIAAGAISRAPMAVIMAALPHARADGLSRRVGRPVAGTVALACGLATLAGAVLIADSMLPAVLAVIAVSGLLALSANSKIGGQTGDVLGASQQLAELAVLVVATGRLDQ